MIKRMLNIFKIHRDERWLAFASTIVFALLNALTVAKYYGSFSQLSDNYHKLFVRTFQVSGFDPLTYSVLSQWDTEYNVYRHPLLAFFMYPFNQINQGLMMATGMNFATTVAALMLIGCSVYSCIFLFRILRSAIGTTIGEAYMLCALYFSFAFVMLSTMVPDHFIMSMFALLLTLHLSGEKLKQGKALNMWQTIAVFVLTAGISLNNGLKIFLAALVTRRWKFFKPGYLILAVLLPAALMWGFARWEYRTFVWPKEMARAEMKKKKVQQQHDALRMELKDSLGLDGKTMTAKDSAKLQEVFKKENQRRAVAKYRKDHKQIWNKNTGKPIGKGEFMRWTDKTTDRWSVAVECLFGEALQLHEDYLLGDVLRNRPVIVKYDTAGGWGYVNYIAEAAIVLLFLIGIWCGRRSLLLWTAMSMFAMDMVLHMGLGFGINEIYIMTAHYMFVIPIAMGYIYNKVREKHNLRLASYALCTALALWCWIWNGRLLLEFMM